MRFTFLGTGTSAGIPMIGCACSVCSSTDPRDNRTRCSAAIEFTDPLGRPRVVLIDTSPDLRVQALRAKLMRCDAILYTHNHVDHMFGLDEVRRFNAVQQAPIDLYADGRTMDALERVYKHIFDRENNVNDSFVASLLPRRIPDADVDAARPLADVFGLVVRPLRLHHGKLPMLGYRIDGVRPAVEKATGWGAAKPAAANADEPLVTGSIFPLAYCTDVSAIPTDTWPRLRGLRTLVLDCLRHRHHPTHLTLGQALSVAQEVGAAQTYFIHMSHELAHEATQSILPEGVHLAYDGLTLT